MTSDLYLRVFLCPPYWPLTFIYGVKIPRVLLQYNNTTNCRSCLIWDIVQPGLFNHCKLGSGSLDGWINWFDGLLWQLVCLHWIRSILSAGYKGGCIWGQNITVTIQYIKRALIKILLWIFLTFRNMPSMSHLHTLHLCVHKYIISLAFTVHLSFVGIRCRPHPLIYFYLQVPLV